MGLMYLMTISNLSKIKYAIPHLKQAGKMKNRFQYISKLNRKNIILLYTKLITLHQSIC